MRTKVLDHLKKAIRTNHHVQRAYTQAVSYYRYRSGPPYLEAIALWRAYLSRRREWEERE